MLSVGSVGVVSPHSALWRSIDAKARAWRAAKEREEAQAAAETRLRLRERLDSHPKTQKRAKEAKLLLLQHRRAVAILRAVNVSEKVLRRVAAEYGITVADIKGPSHYRIHSIPRQDAAYRLYLLRQSWRQIGRNLGGRDHSTAFHAVRAHMERNGIVGIPHVVEC